MYDSLNVIHFIPVVINNVFLTCIVNSYHKLMDHEIFERNYIMHLPIFT